MRADRLLSLLMLLQTKGRMTAAELATELEVSERTIYRDIESLSMAGIPVYAERGPGGGCALMDHFRTNLTWLNEDEINALSMLGIPAPLVELGVQQSLKGALLKLAASVAGQYNTTNAFGTHVYLDSVGWFHAEEPVPHLQTIYRAVLENNVLELTYNLPFDTRVSREVKPYGLVAKTSIWYLICERDGNLAVHQASNILSATATGSKFERPLDFDLIEFWNLWCEEFESTRPHFTVSVRASMELVPDLLYHSRKHILHSEAIGSPDDSGWQPLLLTFETFEIARMFILNCGRAIEVVEPLALRLSVIDFAAQIMDFYGGR